MIPSRPRQKPTFYSPVSFRDRVLDILPRAGLRVVQASDLIRSECEDLCKRKEDKIGDMGRKKESPGFSPTKKPGLSWHCSFSARSLPRDKKQAIVSAPDPRKGPAPLSTGPRRVSRLSHSNEAAS